MRISYQQILSAGAGALYFFKGGDKVASGKVLDYAVESCLDDDGNIRCSKPFLAHKSTCLELSYSTNGTLSHTTLEVRDAGSDELVHYQDFDGQWTPEKTELVYLDFKPKGLPQTFNSTVEYSVRTCK